MLHEIWQDIGDNGMILHTCCFAGTLGAGCRQTLSTHARLLATFEAGSHFEAMTIYNRYLGREAYTTIYDDDYLPYPDE